MDLIGQSSRASHEAEKVQDRDKHFQTLYRTEKKRKETEDLDYDRFIFGIDYLENCKFLVKTCSLNSFSTQLTGASMPALPALPALCVYSPQLMILERYPEYIEFLKSFI